MQIQKKIEDAPGQGSEQKKTGKLKEAPATDELSELLDEVLEDAETEQAEAERRAEEERAQAEKRREEAAQRRAAEREERQRRSEGGCGCW